MTGSEENAARPLTNGSGGPDTPRRFQFSIRAVLIAMAAVAVGCSVIFAMPEWVAIPILIFCMIVLPAVLTTIMVYGTTRQRTFAIGAFFPAGFMALWLGFFALGWGYNGDGETVVVLAIVVAIAWIASVASGLLCLWVRYVIERKESSDT
jgi:hypothetical protein